MRLVGLWTAYVAFVPVVAAPAHAQELGLRGQLAWPDGRDLTAVHGVVLAGGTARAGPRLWLEAQVGSETQRSAALCPPVSPPGVCVGGTEPTDLDARLIGLALGWAVRMAAPGLWTVDAVPEIGGVNVRSKRTGQETGDAMTRRKTLPRVGLALEVGRRISRTIPIRAVAAGRAMRAFSFGGEGCLGCYLPSFRNGFTAVGVELQLSYLFD